MKSLKLKLLGIIVASGLLIGGGNAFAQTALLPGTIDSNAGNVLQNADLASWSFLDYMASPYSATDISGTLSTWVTNNTLVTGGGLNPFGSSALTFLYQFSNTGTAPVEALSLNGFGSFNTDVAYSTTMSYTNMASVSRLSSGDTISVAFPSPGNSVNPGSYGELIVYTDATTYYKNPASLQNGYNASASIFAPVPEPETYAMLIAGLGLMGFVARRRKNRGTSA